MKVKENGTDVGLDKHLIQESESLDTTISDEIVSENHNAGEKITTGITTEKTTKEASDPDDPSQAFQASQIGDPES